MSTNIAHPPEILSRKYAQCYSLRECLVKQYPSIEPLLPADFVQFLNCTFVASKNPNIKLATVPVEVTGEYLIDQFGRARTNDVNSSLALFKRLINDELRRKINRECALFYRPPGTNYCLQLSGNQFFFDYQTTAATLPDAELWTRVTPSHMVDVFGSLASRFAKGNDLNKPSSGCIDPVMEEYTRDIRVRNWFRTHNQVVINRSDLLHSCFSSGQVRTSHFILNRQPPPDVISVKREMFRGLLDFPEKAASSVGHRSDLDRVIEQICANYTRCNFESLLETHCPVEWERDCQSINKSRDDMPPRTAVKQLNSFIYAILYYIFPSDLFGSLRNFYTFYNNLKLIFSASSSCKLRSFDIIKNLNLKEMRPLFEDLYSSKSLIDGEIEIQALLWVYSIVKHCTKCKFYVTESGNRKKTLSYYRFDLWAGIRAQMIDTQKRDKQWMVSSTCKSEAPSDAPAEPCSIQCSLRLVPKRRGVRPLVVPRRHSTSHPPLLAPSTEKQCLLPLLRRLNTLAAFDNSQDRSPSSQSLGYKLKALLQAHNDSTLKDYYIIKGDFQDCYQSISLEKLYHIFYEHLKKLVQKFGHNGEGLPETMIYTEVKIKKQSHYLVDFVIHPETSLDGTPCIMQLVIEQLGSRINNAVVTTPSSGKSVTWPTKTILILLKNYLNYRPVRLGKKSHFFFLQGIPQGGQLSAELCDLYLNHVWLSNFADLKDRQDVLVLRYADDFLFVTPKWELAEKIYQDIGTAFLDFNLLVNPEKLKINFDTKTGKIDSSRTIGFLGRQLHSSLAVGLDLGWEEGQHVAGTFNCNPFLPVRDIMNKLIDGVQFYCYPEQFDAELGSIPVVASNLFQRFVVCALQLAGFVCVSPSWRGSHSSHPLAYHICLFGYHLACKMWTILKRWHAAGTIHLGQWQLIHLQWLSASALRLVWTDGPHKVSSRRVERKTIQEYCQLIERHIHGSFQWLIRHKLRNMPECLRTAII